MVKMKITIWDYGITTVGTIIMLLLFMQCQTPRFTTKEMGDAIDTNVANPTNSIYLLDRDNWGSMYICAFVNAYFEQPKSIDFLIRGFDRTVDSAFMRKTYSGVYHLLEQYKYDLLLYCTDSVTAIFYKKISLPNIVAASVCVIPEKSNRDKHQSAYLYYDIDGYLVDFWEKEEPFRKEHGAIGKKYDSWILAEQKDYTDYRFEMTFLQYTPEQGLVNAETKKPVDINESDYYKEVGQWMKETCRKNNYSRMIVPSAIPKISE